MPEGSVAHGIIEADRLEQWANTFHSKGSGQDSPLLREAKVLFDGDGIHITAVDAANVAAFYDATLAPRGFEAYDSPGAVRTGLSFRKLLDRIGPAASDALVEFDVNMETRHLELHYGNTDLSLAMIDPDSIRSEPDEKEFDLPNTVTLEGEQIKHAVNVADMLSDHIDIIGDVDGRQIRFESQGDTDDMTVSYSDEDVIDAKVGKDAESKYSVGYLNALTKPIPDAAEVTIQFGQEFPMLIDWSSMEGAFTVRQMMAPRIQAT